MTDLCKASRIWSGRMSLSYLKVLTSQQGEEQKMSIKSYRKCCYPRNTFVTSTVLYIFKIRPRTGGSRGKHLFLDKC